jgi:hypothetical protein
LDGTAVALVRFKRLTLKVQERVENQEKRRMVAAVRELPTTGYALQVDGRLKTEFETKEGAWTGAEELKKRFPMLRVRVYDAETKTTEEFQLP